MRGVTVSMGKKMYYTPQEAANILANRINQPHHVAGVISECLAAERDRCADHCAVLAWMIENGAGEDDPGSRLRQAERDIRRGEPIGNWFDAKEMRGV